MRSHFILLVVALLVVHSELLSAQVESSQRRWECLSATAFPAISGGWLSSPGEAVAGLSLLSTAAVSRLDRKSATILGGVIGAAVGYTTFYFYCRDRFCEMWPVTGILGGAVVGSSIGRVLAEGPRRSTAWR
jgi:hypothetical protein